MSNRLEGKVALITAAGQGIGRAIAEAFGKEGGKVIATDVAEDKVREVTAAKRLKLDVRAQDNVDAVAKMVASEFGALDILVNCAGYVHNGSILDCADRDWDFSFDLNVKSMHQGGGHRPDQVGRRRFHQARHPLQRDLPRHDRVTVAGRTHRDFVEGNWALA
jgi:NAD(P)-dependent dehydrogenase (short-subunit alcohol dehydrogenase family)